MIPLKEATRDERRPKETLQVVESSTCSVVLTFLKLWDKRKLHPLVSHFSRESQSKEFRNISQGHLGVRGLEKVCRNKFWWIWAKSLTFPKHEEIGLFYCNSKDCKEQYWILGFSNLRAFQAPLQPNNHLLTSVSYKSTPYNSGPTSLKSPCLWALVWPCKPCLIPISWL